MTLVPLPTCTIVVLHRLPEVNLLKSLTFSFQFGSISILYTKQIQADQFSHSVVPNKLDAFETDFSDGNCCHTWSALETGCRKAFNFKQTVVNQILKEHFRNFHSEFLIFFILI